MATHFESGRPAFTCGFGPGHHAHPRRTLALAQHPPVVVRVASVHRGTITVIHEDGSRSEWWHHDHETLEDTARHSDGVAFLHADAVLRVGGRLFSVTSTPTPCGDGTAHLDPHHPAWAGPPVGPPPPVEDGTEPREKKHNRHPEPGHHLPFWRLEAALAKGPGVIVDLVDPRSSGEIVLEIAGARLRRYHHNPQRITAALTEVDGGDPYEYPDGAYRLRPHPDVRRGATVFGDVPTASLLDDEVLRIGDAYFWLGRSGDRSPRTCGYLDGPSSQYLRQKHMGMYVGIQWQPAPTERVFLTEIARVVANEFRPFADEEEVVASATDADPPAGFVVPAGDTSTEEGREDLAGRITAAARSMFAGWRTPSYPAIALYGEPIIQ